SYESPQAMMNAWMACSGSLSGRNPLSPHPFPTRRWRTCLPEAVSLDLPLAVWHALGVPPMSMAYWVYALSSVSRNYINVGLSTNAVSCIEEHQRMKEKTMDAYRPFAGLLFERFETRPLAREREKFLKSGRGKAFLKDLRTRFTGESTPAQVAE